MKDKNIIEIIDTKEKFLMKIGDCVFDKNNIMITEYKIKRYDGKNGYQVVVTFSPDILITNIDLKEKGVD